MRSRVLFVFGCIGVAALSFWLTLVLLDDSGAPSLRPRGVVTTLPPGTPQTTLADLPPLPDTRFSWIGIGGINAQVVAGGPAASGQHILRLIAVQDGLHTLAARLNGLVDRTTVVLFSILPAGGFCRPLETQSRALSRSETG
jgi:hypothetical protein